MKRILLILFIILMSVSPISAKTLQGGVEYTEAQIKKMAFDGVKKKLPQKMINANKIDPFFDENKALREKGIKETDDRVIHFFDDGSYYIYYKKSPQYIYLYDSIGNILGYTITEKKENVYPYKMLAYDKNADLYWVTYFYQSEVYIYDANGNFKKQVNAK